ncbi:MAG: hypothetical protein SGI74_02480 [Oligoflexia bacterium]|nr:hypothetical protein [Oligoflexia bacterium]
MKIIFFLTVCIFLRPNEAVGFPEMVRHGYVNCISCHVSPSGGGVLTPYGRELTKEVLSTWGREGEGAFAYGAIKFPTWIHGGGDLRFLQIYRDTPTLREAAFFPMQTDLEMAATSEKWAGVVSGGVQRSIHTPPQKGEFFSRRHFLIYKPTEEVHLRAGKFLHNFGINMPEHNAVTKGNDSGLGFNQGTETYNLEASYLGENLNAYLTGLFGRPDATRLNREKGLSSSVSYFFMERYKAGVSYFYGENNTASRHVAGPFFILGFTQKFFLLSEFDYQSYKSKSLPETLPGFVNYQRLNYEFIQGFHGYVTQEYSQLNLNDSNTVSRAYGIGTQWFPRPHFEFNLYWQKQLRVSQFSQYIDVAWLMMNFYP